MSERQIFIVGTGRSGTSILKKILNHHSQIFTYPKELRFICDRNGLMDMRNYLTRDWNPHNASDAVEAFVKLMKKHLFKTNLYEKVLNRFFKKILSGSGRKYASVRMGDFINYQHLEKNLNYFLEDLGVKIIRGYWYGSESYQINPKIYYCQPLNKKIFDKSAGEFIDHLLSYPLIDSEKTCWCDDTPMNILYADILSQMLVDVKILHIYRNPLDVVASYSDSNQAWAPKNLEYAAGWVKEVLTKWMSLRNIIPSKNYLEVKYEYLISNQKEGLQKIMSFIGLDFEKSLLNLQLTADSVDRYKLDIPDSAIANLKSILKPVLKEYAYESETM